VEVAGSDGVTFAKGLAQMSAGEVSDAAGKHSTDVAADATVAIHRDDLVFLPS